MGTNFKKKKITAIVLTVLLSTVFCLSLFLLIYQRAYANKIVHNVYFNNVHLEGKTRAQAKLIIQNQTDPLLDNKLITKADNGKQYEATFAQTGIYFDPDQTIATAFSVGRNEKFFPMLYSLAKTTLEKKELIPNPKFDDEAYNAYLTSTEENLDMPPVNASLSISNGQIITNNGSNGVTINSSGLKDEIAKEILDKSNTVVIDIPTTPITPTLQTESLSDAKSTAESYLLHTISLTLNNQIYTADSSIIASWISFGLQNDKYQAWLNETAIKTYLGKIAAKNDITVIDTKISAIDNATILQEGRQGIYINQADALNKIKAAIGTAIGTATIALQQTTKDPQVTKVFPDEGIVPGRFPGKYIDIDLTKQLLTLFNGTNQEGQFIVSSGKASTPTPTGTRTIDGHNPKAWSAPYGLYMPWWISMGGGYGIHELPEWPSGYKEGANHLGIPVSHGCVRLGIGPAEFVYNWTPDGTQVYIHK